MKRFIFALALFSTPAFAQEPAKVQAPQPPVVVALSQQDIQVIAAALNGAGSHCGAADTTSCQIGILSKGILDKFAAAEAAKPAK